MRYRRITGRLVARSSIHVGTGTGGGTTDAFCRRDACGRLIVPGFAIAGALRSLSTRLAPRLWPDEVCVALQDDLGRRGDTCQCIACRLFGCLNPKDREGDGQAEPPASPARASRICVNHALAAEPAAPTIVRDLAGIDRVDGTAARRAGARFDLELVPSGAVFHLDLEYEPKAEGTEDPEEILLAAALGEWTEGRATIGGRAARGCGAFDLREVSCRTVDLSRRADLMSFLRQKIDRWADAPVETDWLTRLVEDARSRIVPAAATNPHVASGFARVSLTLEADGPFLVNDDVHAVWSGFDHAPVLARMVEGLPVLPGSGWRGVLRSHAERIARTLTTLQTADSDGYRAACPACNPLASRRSGERGVTGESCDSLLRNAPGRQEDAEAVEDDLCLACRLFGSPQKGSRLLVEDGVFVAQAQTQGAAAEIDGLAVAHKPQDFLAIDRFTGGSRDGAKFDAEPLWKPAFEVRMRLDNPRTWEIGWLLLVLRDIHEGRVAVGFGGAKGFGRMKVMQWTVAIGRLTNYDFPLDAAVVGAGETLSGVHTVSSVSHADGEVPEPLHRLASSWVAEFSDKVRTFERKSLPALPSDSYFGTETETLYPRRGDVHA